MAHRPTRMEPPVTLAHVHARHRWVMPLAGTVFVLLAIGAAHEWLPWDRPITKAAVDARTPSTDAVALKVSFLGSTPVVLSVAFVAAAVAWRRSPRLAVAIVVIALARPLAEWALKELIGRDRPVGDRLVAGRGPSFPSGHPMAAASSWCLLPLVVELYARKPLVWWATVVTTWTLAVGVAATRVWLGVHWTSDVVGGLLLAVLGVAVAERIMHHTYSRRTPLRTPGRAQIELVAFIPRPTKEHL
ncbi:MAG: phosphatase PAP2 family protein [Acidimicrobiales bacterium]